VGPSRLHFRGERGDAALRLQEWLRPALERKGARAKEEWRERRRAQLAAPRVSLWAHGPS
jgi:hypothetical protein